MMANDKATSFKANAHFHDLGNYYQYFGQPNKGDLQ